jgi:hypothetical protein
MRRIRCKLEQAQAVTVSPWRLLQLVLVAELYTKVFQTIWSVPVGALQLFSNVLLDDQSGIAR